MHQLINMILYVLQKNIQSDTYEWPLDKLTVNRHWSVLIGKYEFVCCAEIIQTITYGWTSDELYVEADETIWELCAVGRCARVVINHVCPRRLRTRPASYNAK